MNRFIPARGLRNGHFQTLYPALFSKPNNPEIEIETFDLPDGDFVECVWHQKPVYHDKRPIVVLFHGLAGSFESPYIKRAMHLLGAAGYAVVLMHFRGCYKKPNRLPRSYHSGDTADAKAWIEHLKTTYHDSPLFAVGYSLGANMLLKLQGEWREESPLIASVAVSAPMDLRSSANKMTCGFSQVYQYRLMRLLKKQLLEKYDLFDMESLIGLNRDGVGALGSFWEFDDAYTAPIHGFKDAREYYRRSSSKPYLKEIKKDTLIIQSKDDPFMGEKVIPKEEALSSAVSLELYEHGGHVGFVSGAVWSPKYWMESRILAYLSDYRS